MLTVPPDDDEEQDVFTRDVLRKPGTVLTKLR